MIIFYPYFGASLVSKVLSVSYASVLAECGFSAVSAPDSASIWANDLKHVKNIRVPGESVSLVLLKA